MIPSYAERMRESSLREVSFPPMSYWKYTRNSNLDKLVNDSESYDFNPATNFMKEGRGSFLSKFNTEYAKRIIEYWTKEGDTIIDPFAGRTSRPIISTLLGRNYIGFDVIKNNLNDAQQQYDVLSKKHDVGKLQLIHSSSEYIDTYIKDKADMVFTCPPYFTLEKYDSCDGQLTDINKYEDFLKIYSIILQKSAKLVKPGGFMVVVIANFRSNGKFIDFRGDTAAILKESLTYFDEIILEMSPAKREPLYSQAVTNLNILKTHEYALVFRNELPKEEQDEFNYKLNSFRPTVQEIHGREKLFWKDKPDWIDIKFQQHQNKFF